MPVIYYRYYQAPDVSIPQVTKLEHTIGRELLLLGLKNIFHLAFSPEELDLVLAQGEHGKPYLSGYPQIHFNISHCNNLVVCAFDTRPLGADAELKNRFSEILLKKVLTREERQFYEAAATSEALRLEWFFRFWTLKEAYVKKTGTGVTVSLSDFSFTFSGEGDSMSIRCSNPFVHCFQKLLPSGHVLSLCCESDCREVSLLEC